LSEAHSPLDTPRLFQVEVTSISGVAASQVLPGPPRRGSNRSIMRFLDRLSDLGARPDDPHDERFAMER
jgi:hypothetical protein